MMRLDSCLSGPFRPSDYLRTARYVADQSRLHPDRLDEDGIIVFCGTQGSGKTLSAVRYVQQLAHRYPRSILVSNIEITSGLPDDYTVLPWDGLKSLTDITNDEYGVIYLIDEIHLLFNSLESKSIPIELFTCISQQRKQRKLIVATSQLFLRLAKPFREQARRVVMCRPILRYIQLNRVLDGATLSEVNGEILGNQVGLYIWFHSPALYQSYDTYALVRRSKNDWQTSSARPTLLPYADLFAGQSN